MKQTYSIIIALIICLNINAQQLDTKSMDSAYFGTYLGLEEPDLIPKIFAPGLISGKGRMHSFISFAPDMKTIFWATIPPKIMMMRMIAGKWTLPEVAPFSNTNNNQSPCIVDNDVIYFSSTRSGGFGHLDIWYTTFTNGSFMEPVNLGENINSDKLESHPSISKDKSLFFTGTTHGKLYNRGIYYSDFVKGVYSDPILLAEPINIMDTSHLDYTPFIAADESYLLFCSNRQNPEIERCHIYISYKNNEGEWGKPIDLSIKMGFTESSKFPYVSPDGKFLFFSSGENVYWIGSKILEIEHK